MFDAENYGADWLVVQEGYAGQVVNCWRLSDVSLTSESESDGWQWYDNQTNNLVRISGGIINISQVRDGNFLGAAALIGIDATKCSNGSYGYPQASVPAP